MKPPSLAAAFTVAHASAGLDCADRCMRVALRMYSLPPLTLALAFTLLSPFNTSFAQTYPSKPVRILSGQPPGGATDFFARMVAQRLNEAWKQPMVIEHRPGASGSIAVELTAKSPPDGHTLVFVTAGQIVINPHLLKLSYDPLTDLAPVAFLVHTAMLLVTHPSVPATSPTSASTLRSSPSATPPHGYQRGRGLKRPLA